MKTVSFRRLAIIFVAGLCSVAHTAEKIPVITESKEVSKHVGRKITIVGPVSNTKQPQLLGVDVSANETDLRGKQAEATGILERFEITPAQAKELDRMGVAHRGAGVFYRLRDEKRNTEAQVKARK